MDIKRNWYIIEDKAKPTLQQLNPPPCTPVKNHQSIPPITKMLGAPLFGMLMQFTFVIVIYYFEWHVRFTAIIVHYFQLNFLYHFPAETMGGVK